MTTNRLVAETGQDVQTCLLEEASRSHVLHAFGALAEASLVVAGASAAPPAFFIDENDSRDCFNG